MINIGTTTLTCDKSSPPRPILPEQCRYPIFTQFHNLCHSNWKSMSRMILARFTWPDAQRTIKEWCHNCLTCQQMKITRHIHPPIRQLNEAVARFTHVHMDIVGPLPAINNSPFRYLVTFIDRSTNWIEAHRTFHHSRRSLPRFSHVLVFSLRSTIVHHDWPWNPIWKSIIRTTFPDSRILQTPYNFISSTEQWKSWTFSSKPQSSFIVSKDRLDSSTTRSSFRIEVKTGHQSHFTVSSHNRTRCTLPDNSCRKDSTHHSRLHQKPSGQPGTASFDKRYQTTFNTKDLIPDALENCKFVWLRVDRVKQPLEAPYTGPHELIKINRDSSTATIQKNNDHIIVSIQRLKPCTLSFDREKKKHHHLQSSTVPTEVYCYCQQPCNRKMIKCCNNNCKIAWYHYDCVSLRKHPLTTWFCPSCRTSTTKRVTIVEPEDAESNDTRCRRHKQP